MEEAYEDEVENRWQRKREGVEKKMSEDEKVIQESEETEQEK